MGSDDSGSNSSSQSVFPGPAAPGSPGNFVSVQILRPRPDLLSQRLRVESGGGGGAGPNQVVSQALQVVLMNLEVENHSPKRLRRLGYWGVGWGAQGNVGSGLPSCLLYSLLTIESFYSSQRCSQ